MLVVISVILYICVIVMAKPVLINQSKPFTVKELRILFDYHDHNSGSCVRRFQYWAGGPKLEISADKAIQQPLKLLSETSLANSWGEGADSRGHSECTANTIDGSAAAGHVIRHQSALQMISVVCWSCDGYQAFTEVSNHGQRIAWRAALNDSHASTTEQALQLLAAVTQASETVIPAVHAIEDKGMNFQM